MSIEIRTAYGENRRLRVPLTFTRPSLAMQAMQAECDINNVMARHRQTGLITHYNERKPLYDDVSNVTDYHGALNAVYAAQEAFMDLPAATRKAFDNDPGLFIAAFDDPSQWDRLRELGLLPAKQAEPEVPQGGAAAPPPAPKEDA